MESVWSVISTWGTLAVWVITVPYLIWFRRQTTDRRLRGWVTFTIGVGIILIMVSALDIFVF